MPTKNDELIARLDKLMGNYAHARDNLRDAQHDKLMGYRQYGPSVSYWESKKELILCCMDDTLNAIYALEGTPGWREP